MKFGAHVFLTDQTISVVDLAGELEARSAFESLWLPEHTHIPTSRETAWPLEGVDMPEEYRRVVDPFVSLAAAAATTRTLVVGTGVCLVAQHDPIVLAKAIATLDQLSGGRFVFGIGLGWNLEEMRNHGVEPGRRRAIVREKMLAMEGLWRDEVSGFDGEFVRLAESWSWPKPSGGRPQVLIGASAGARTFGHIAEYADGWMPDMSFTSGDDLLRGIREMRSVAEAAGRDPSTMQVTAMACPPIHG